MLLFIKKYFQCPIWQNKSKNMGIFRALNWEFFNCHLPWLFQITVTHNSLFEVCHHWFLLFIYPYIIPKISPILTLHRRIKQNLVISYLILSPHTSLIIFIRKNEYSIDHMEILVRKTGLNDSEWNINIWPKYGMHIQYHHPTKYYLYCLKHNLYIEKLSMWCFILYVLLDD